MNMDENDEMICLTPYKELKQGEESIYDHIQEGYQVPDKVIAYLMTTKPYVMSPGVYKHPFKKEVDLYGPYMYTDGIYFWDRDTWKYVVNYGLTLPQSFIDHVMGDAGTKFLKEQGALRESWDKTISEWKRGGLISFLPENAGSIDIEDF